MDIVQYLTSQIGVQGIWFALFLGMGLLYNKKTAEQLKDSKAREDKLSDQLSQSQEVLQSFASKYDLIITRLDSLQSALTGKPVTTSNTSQETGGIKQ